MKLTPRWLLASIVTSAFALVAVPVESLAAVRGQVVEYKDGDTVLEGYLSTDETRSVLRPGVLIVHDWMGLGQQAKDVADKLAALGYTAFAADIYGKDVRPKDAKEAGELAGTYKGDRALFRQRMRAGLKALQSDVTVDQSKLAAIGYCFGGTGVLELARDGAEVNGFVSFHGGLATPTPATRGAIKGKVLVLHGADDPYAPAEEVAALQKELNDAGADWQVVLYGGAVHSFTNPDAGTDVSKGAAYDAKADHRSWEALRVFLKEIF